MADNTVYANTPLNPDDPDHARVISWRDIGGSRNKSDTMRKLATGGGILHDAGLLDLVISLEKMPGIDARKALRMALASIDDDAISAPAPAPAPAEPQVVAQSEKKRPVLGRLK